MTIGANVILPPDQEGVQKISCCSHYYSLSRATAPVAELRRKRGAADLGMVRSPDSFARRQSVLDHCDKGFDNLIAGSVAIWSVPNQNPIHDAQHEE